MFENGIQKNGIPLIIVCDDKYMAYANYLIQLIGQKKDAADGTADIVDDRVSAAIYTIKNYRSNLAQIPSKQHVLFIGRASVVKEQGKTIPDRFNKLGMHYGWLGKRAVLYVDDAISDWLKPGGKIEHYTEFWQYSKERGISHPDVLAEYIKEICSRNLRAVAIRSAGFGAGKNLFDHIKAINEIKAQQYRTLIKVFYEDDLRSFVEG